MSILHSTCIWFQPSYCMNGDENSCFRCLLGRKIGSLVTQPQPTIDWHHFLQNYHVLFFVVISFDDSENPNNQLANSFDFTGFLQEMSTSQVLRRGNSDKATKGFVQSDPFETTARWKKKSPQNCPQIWAEIPDSVWRFFWHDHIIHVSFQCQKPPNFLFGHWTSLQNCCVDTCGNLSSSKHRRFGTFFSCCFHVCCSYCWWKKLCNGWF